MKVSIAIPAYEYGGYGAECLEHSFRKMVDQTFKDFNVIISDSSTDEEIEKLCKKWGNVLDIKYIRNMEALGNPSMNMNNAVRHSDGEWIKFLCQDDYLYSENALQKTVDAIDETHKWIATGYYHTYDKKNYENYHAPYLNPRIYVVNTIGTPSCVTIKNDGENIDFEENLIYCWDCEFYYRYFLEYGPPKTLEDVTIVNYLWGRTITAKITNEKIREESAYVLRKHGFIKDEDDI